jgi:hypothetical protein
MQLERIGVALRPRTPQEAMDLGMTMLRAHARPVWSAWFVFSLPIFLACQALAWLLDMPWLGLLLPWWLRPLFDRVPLYVLSRAVFEKAPTWRETLRGQWRWPWMRTVAALTWLRVDTNRSLRMPMELLEGVSSAQRSARWRVLSRPLVGTASGLTWTCLVFELVLFISLGVFAVWLIPTETLPDSIRNVNQAFSLPAFRHALIWIASGLTYLSMSIVEPLYIAAGFGLYLNRRTQLEAWDIDLNFRRLRQRLLDAGVALALLLCVGCFALPARAADAQVPADPPKTAPTQINIEQAFHQPLNDKDALFAHRADAVYRSPQFGTEHLVEHWVPRFEQDAAPQTTRSTWLMPFANLASGAINLIAWILLALVLGALAIFAVRLMRGVAPSMTGSTARQAKVLRNIVHQEAVLPEDLAGATRELWRQGHHREALSLLYRGSVQNAAALLRMQAAEDATEADWLRHASAIEDATRRERLVAIVRTWQLAAYADRYPRDAEVDALLSGWPAQRVAS